jgi:hypothetical protein
MRFSRPVLGHGTLNVRPMTLMSDGSLPQLLTGRFVRAMLNGLDAVSAARTDA